MQCHLIILIAAAALLPITAQASERVIYAKHPEYPAEAIRQHLTGSGVFALHVRADGSIEQVETIHSIGHPSLDRAAIAAFRKWRFRAHNGPLVFRVPIRYVDGPPHVDALMSQPRRPGYGGWITVFSRSK
ncbi:MAG: energy transducer TonB [Rhodanobacteraceae bacterium]